jgi:NAD-dependent dihydropyrimidine dehydrogenase PreA subunit
LLRNEEVYTMNMQYLKGVAKLYFYEKECIGCGICINVCPHEVFEQLEDGTVIVKDQDRCMECGACALNCPVNAVEVKAGVG